MGVLWPHLIHLLISPAKLSYGVRSFTWHFHTTHTLFLPSSPTSPPALDGGSLTCQASCPCAIKILSTKFLSLSLSWQFRPVFSLAILEFQVYIGRSLSPWEWIFVHGSRCESVLLFCMCMVGFPITVNKTIFTPKVRFWHFSQKSGNVAMWTYFLGPFFFFQFHWSLWMFWCQYQTETLPTTRRSGNC